MAGIEDIRTTTSHPKPGAAIVVAPSGRPPSSAYTAPVVRSGSVTRPPADTDPTTDGKGGKSAVSSAQAQYNAAQRKAADRYRRQAKNLEAQAAALRHALRVDLRKGLFQQISDINQVSRQQDHILREGFRSRLEELRGAADDNEKAAETQSSINLQNQIRERNSAVGEAMSQGAGESDVLNSMLMSLRNWNANQTEIERGYHDTLRSIQSGQTDLTVDTKTALMNNEIQRNADKEQLWTNYHNQRSEIFTQLGNVRGQQADYYAMANEMGSGGGGGGKKKADGGGKTGGAKAESGKGGSARLGRTVTKGPGIDGGGGVNRATAQAGAAFMSASKELGKSWDNPGVSRKIMRWDGKPEIESTRSPGPGYVEAKTVSLAKKPEGATLRKW